MKTKNKSLFLLKIGILFTLLMTLFMCHDVKADETPFVPTKRLIIKGDITTCGGIWGYNYQAKVYSDYRASKNDGEWVLTLVDTPDGGFTIVDSQSALYTAAERYYPTGGNDYSQARTELRFEEISIIQDVMQISGKIWSRGVCVDIKTGSMHNNNPDCTAEMPFSILVDLKTGEYEIVGNTSCHGGSKGISTFETDGSFCVNSVNDTYKNIFKYPTKQLVLNGSLRAETKSYFYYDNTYRDNKSKEQDFELSIIDTADGGWRIEANGPTVSVMSSPRMGDFYYTNTNTATVSFNSVTFVNDTITIKGILKDTETDICPPAPQNNLSANSGNVEFKLILKTSPELEIVSFTNKQADCQNIGSDPQHGTHIVGSAFLDIDINNYQDVYGNIIPRGPQISSNLTI